MLHSIDLVFGRFLDSLDFGIRLFLVFVRFLDSIVFCIRLILGFDRFWCFFDGFDRFWDSIDFGVFSIKMLPKPLVLRHFRK